MKALAAAKSMANIVKFGNYRWSSSIVAGRATVEGTKNFVQRSNLKLFHQFQSSGLYITPIIHGSPKEAEGFKEEKEFYDFAIGKAILYNKSNCVIAYHSIDPIPTAEHKSTKPVIWVTDALASLIENPDNGVLREEIVVGANLGYASTPSLIHQRLEQALLRSRLEYLDFAFIEISDAVMDFQADYLDEICNDLQALCEEGKLHFFGIKMSIVPYIYHTPPYRRTGKYVSLPSQTEHDIVEEKFLADMVIYPLSPSIAIPSSLSMMDPSAGSKQYGEPSSDLDRPFTRVAWDPLTCFPGIGKDDLDFIKEEAKEIAARHNSDLDSPVITAPTQVPWHKLQTVPWFLVDNGIPPLLADKIAQYLDDLCPPLKSTPSLQNKALRVVFSAGMDVMMLDAELSGMLDPLSLGPEDMLSFDETEGVFGHFAVPSIDPTSAS